MRPLLHSRYIHEAPGREQPDRPPSSKKAFAPHPLAEYRVEHRPRRSPRREESRVHHQAAEPSHRTGTRHRPLQAVSRHLVLGCRRESLCHFRYATVPDPVQGDGPALHSGESVAGAARETAAGRRRTALATARSCYQNGKLWRPSRCFISRSTED